MSQLNILEYVFFYSVQNSQIWDITFYCFSWFKWCSSFASFEEKKVECETSDNDFKIIYTVYIVNCVFTKFQVRTLHTIH